MQRDRAVKHEYTLWLVRIDSIGQHILTLHAFMSQYSSTETPVLITTNLAYWFSLLWKGDPNLRE
jgi:hypothetical protein